MVWRFSKTASANASADSSINWAEGQAPSSVNDSARAEMARVAQWRDDISGTITTGGTSSAYTVTSNQVFDTLAHMDGAMIAFVPHATSEGSPTLAVDGLAAKKIRFQTGVDFTEGVLVQGTPYVATYYNSVGEFLLHNIAGNPYNIPLGSGIDYWGATAPNSAFVFPIGQAISRTTYAPLFSLFGTTYGSGDGSTTFNVPDKGERVSVMKVSAASRLNSTYFGDSTTLGAVGGSQAHTLTAAELPVITPTFTGTAMTAGLSQLNGVLFSAGIQVTTGASSFAGNAVNNRTTDSFTPAGTISSFGSGTAHAVVQPTIVCNYILRIY